MKKVILLVPISLLLILALLLGACTKATPSPSTTAQPTTTAPTTSVKPATTTTTATTAATTTTVKPVTTFAAAPTTTAVTPTAAPKYGGVLKLINQKGPLKFGYPLNIKGEDNEYSRAMLENIITFDDKGNYVPHLATSWEISPDGKSYTFKIRKGVKFHDGTDLDVHAIKYCLDKLVIDPGPTLSAVTSIDIIDDTVRLNLSEPNSLTLYHLANSPETRIFSPTALEKNGLAWLETNPVGTGPFMFKTFKKDISLTMVKNPNYWQAGLPYLDGLEYSIIASPMTQMVAFKASEAQALVNPNVTIASQLIADGFKFQGGDAGLGFIYGDSKNPASPFANKNVRIAIEYAIDKEELCTTVGQGLFVPGYQAFTVGHPGTNTALPPRKYDPAKAKQLLKEAGFSNGFSATIYVNSASEQDMYVAMQSYLQAVNINLKIEWVSTARYDEIRLGSALPPNSMSHGKAGGATRDAIQGIQGKLTTYSGWHVDIARPAGFDQLVDSVLSATSTEIELAKTREVSKVLYDDQTIIPTWSNFKTVFYNKTVQNPQFVVGGMPNERKFHLIWLQP